ncbi:MAG: ADP-ribosylglycohydrolase family protein [Actinomycetota bacterium]|nr:ADP-ribosylglycohydrolase family protein [Actinomycetota bacterium]
MEDPISRRPTREQFQGCLVGQALGDALGFVVEGQPSTFCRRYVDERLGQDRVGNLGRGPFPLGQYSDDTQLARELLRSYAARGDFDPEDYAGRIAAIFSEGRIVGRGRSTEEAAERLARGVPWDKAGTPPPSAGNGSAMRAGPIGLLFYDDPDDLAQAARAQGMITHRDTRCSAGAITIAGAVALALREGPVERLEFLGRLSELTVRVHAPFAQALINLSGWVTLPPEQAVAHISRVGLERKLDEGWGEITPFVMPSVLWSLYSFLKSPEDYWQTIRTAIAVGGDVDTTAAMAGAISGAHLGLGAIPRKLAGRVTDQGSWGFPELTDLAGKCYDVKHREPA